MYMYIYIYIYCFLFPFQLTDVHYSSNFLANVFIVLKKSSELPAFAPRRCKNLCEVCYLFWPPFQPALLAHPTKYQWNSRCTCTCKCMINN